MCFEMARTQIQLTEEQSDALRRLSAATGKSVADLVRQAVELYLRTKAGRTRADLVQRALKAAGKFSSGSATGSRYHDRHFAGTLRG